MNKINSQILSTKKNSNFLLEKKSIVPIIKIIYLTKKTFRKKEFSIFTENIKFTNNPKYINNKKNNKFLLYNINFLKNKKTIIN